MRRMPNRTKIGHGERGASNKIGGRLCVMCTVLRYVFALFLLVSVFRRIVVGEFLGRSKNVCSRRNHYLQSHLEFYLAESSNRNVSAATGRRVASTMCTGVVCFLYLGKGVSAFWVL